MGSVVGLARSLMTKTLGACISLAKHAPVTIVRQMMMIVNPLNTKKYVAVFFVIAPYCIVFVANEFVRKPVQHTRRRRRCKETNVAAIDEDFVAEVCFSLKQYRDMPIELLDDISVVFAGTVEYTQEVFELLMSSMRDVDGHLNFWSKRQKTLNARQQFIFLIFRRGPISFVKDVLSLIGLRLDREVASHKFSGDALAKRVKTINIIKRGIAEAIAATHFSASSLHHIKIQSEHVAKGDLWLPIRMPSNAEDIALIDNLPLRVMNACLESLTKLKAVINTVIHLQHTITSLDRVDAVNINLHPDLLDLNRAASISDRLKEEGERMSITPSRWNLTSSSTVTYQTKVDEAKSIMFSMRASLDENRRFVWGGELDGIAIIVKVPKWSRMVQPSEEWWILNTFQTLVIWRLARFVIAHSRLSGSKDFENWAAAALTVVGENVNEHIVTPFHALRAQFFTRSTSKPGDVTLEKVQLEIESLENMIKTFIENNADPQVSKGSTGMEAVMKNYERDVANPVQGVLSGRLLQEMLLQVQQMKADSSALLFEIDKILATNELTIAFMAAIPAFLLLYSLMKFIWNVVTPNPPSSDEKTVDTIATRVALIELRTQMLSMSSAKANDISKDTVITDDDSIAARRPNQSIWRDTGFALYGMSSVTLAVDRVYRYHGLIQADDKELVLLKKTIFDFYGPMNNFERLRVVESMMSSFTVFRV